MINELQTLLHQGGWVLWMLLLVGVWMYTVLTSSFLTLSAAKHTLQPQATSLHTEPESIVTAYHIHTIDKLGWLERRIPVIAIMIGICTLGGLLGTVIGMLTTFANIASSTHIDPTQKVATGIAKALITTQVGLLLALPASFAFVLLKSRIRNLQSIIETHFHQDMLSLYRRK